MTMREPVRPANLFTAFQRLQEREKVALETLFKITQLKNRPAVMKRLAQGTIDFLRENLKV